jgi:hypothetical protein
VRLKKPIRRCGREEIACGEKRVNAHGGALRGGRQFAAQKKRRGFPRLFKSTSMFRAAIQPPDFVITES